MKPQENFQRMHLRTAIKFIPFLPAVSFADQGRLIDLSHLQPSECNCQEDVLLGCGRFIQCCQECVVHAPWVAFALRPSVGQWIYVAICGDDLGVDELTPSKYLAFKERLKSECPGRSVSLFLSHCPRCL